MKNIGVRSIITFCSLLFLTLSSCKKKDNAMVDLYKSGYRNPDLIGNWKLIRQDRPDGTTIQREDSLSISGLQKIIFHSNGDYQIFRFDDTETETNFKKYWYNPDEYSYKVYYNTGTWMYGNSEETVAFSLTSSKDTLKLPTSSSTSYYINY